MSTEYKLLISYPIGKSPTYGYNEALLDGSAQRFTKGQGIFTQTSHTHLLALHIIAQNIRVPCVILEAPTEEDFREEIKKGYTHVALQSFSLQTKELLEMARIVKEFAPSMKVIAGGYGFASVQDAIEKNPELRPLVDYFCEGDGIEFCRKLFNEDTSTPVTQYLPLVSSSYPWLDYYKDGDCATILGGLGCTGKCEFCYTSHMFKGRYLEIANADQIFTTMKMVLRDNPRLNSYIIYDEDFLKYEKKARQLGELICQDEEFGLRRLNYYCFGSNSSIARYDFEELVLMGVQILFVGVESFYPTALINKNIELKRSGGDIRETFRKLHEYGIYTVGATIFGFDHHDRKNIVAEKRAFIELETTWYQINLFCAGPGTALWHRMVKEGRVYDDFDYSMVHHYGVPLKHPNFERYELLDFVDKMYGEVYEYGGPTVLKILNVSLNGYEYCKRSSNPLLNRDKAAFHEQACRDSVVMMKAVKTFAPGGLVAKKVDHALLRYREHFGELTLDQKILSEYIYRQAARAWNHRLKFPNKIPREPTFRKYIYDSETRSQFEKGKRPYRVEYPIYSEHYAKCKEIREHNKLLFGRLPEVIKEKKSDKEILEFYLQNLKDTNLDKF